MSNRNNNHSSGFLKNFFNKNTHHNNTTSSQKRTSVDSDNSKKKQPLVTLVQLYDTYGNNYSYFKSLCLDSNESSTPNSVLNGVQGLKNLITELRYELQMLNKKYPYLVVVNDPDTVQKDDVKVFNSLYTIIKKSEGVLEHVKEAGLQQYGSPDFINNTTKVYSTTNQSSSQSLQQNKMFNKRLMRSMRDHNDTRSSSSSNNNSTGSYQQQTGTSKSNEKLIPTYQEQKRMEKAREEKRLQRLQQQKQKKSYSNTSSGSGSKKVSVEMERNLIDLDDGVGLADPFSDFTNETFDKPEPKGLTRKKSSNILQATLSNSNNNNNSKKNGNNSNNKSINVSLQAAALAAQSRASSHNNNNNNATTTNNNYVSNYTNAHMKVPQPPSIAKKTQTSSGLKASTPSPKRLVVTEESGGNTQTENNELDAKSQKDILEDEILKATPQIDFKMGKQIFQEILVARSSQRPITWDDIIGLDNCKQQLQETIVFPFLRPDLFSGLREPINGLLLYGPPGTGKTMLAKCVAYQTESTFFNVSVSSITSKFLGESEKLVKGVFTLAAKLSPSIIFIDEIDSILGSRGSSGGGSGGGSGGDDSGAAGESSRRFKNEFLTQWSNLSYSLAEDGSFNRVLVLGCTNLPWVIDDAARRRFQKRIYCPLPNFQDRINLIEMLLSKNKDNIAEFNNDQLQELAELTDGFSNSDLLTLCKDASMEPIRELIKKGDNSILNVDKNNIRPINLEDFKTSINSNKIKGSVNLNTIESYDQWTDQFGS